MSTSIEICPFSLCIIFVQENYTSYIKEQREYLKIGETPQMRSQNLLHMCGILCYAMCMHGCVHMQIPDVYS
jgi:hypothetical protein